MNIGFFVRHFTERGTEVAIYDYANYNENILYNKSYIICFNEKSQKENGFPCDRSTYDKFKNRFEVLEIDSIDDMTHLIDNYNLNFFYTLSGGGNDIYKFDNKIIWKKCKTIYHCVFDTRYNQGDYYISISETLNAKFNTNIPVIPHIVTMPAIEETLRKELNIPTDAIVLGRYGGFNEFNIEFVHKTISEFLDINTEIYFLFMNTKEFFNHKRIIYLEKNIDPIQKVKFINTCDAMIHARLMGETFGLSIAEFSSRNKPIITCPCGDLEHIKILGDKAIKYTNNTDLLNIFHNIRNIIQSKNDWNAYSHYSPKNTMDKFDSIFKTKLFTKIVDHNDFKIEYFANDCLSRSSIEIGKMWEPHILEFTKMYNRLFDLKNIIDIGANFGYHSLFFSREVANKGNVYSFEPQIQNYYLLNRNISHNNINNIITYNNACSDVDENVYMPIIETLSNTNMGDFTPNYCSGNMHVVRAMPIDTINLPRIDMIKIDVQGWEIKVLNGVKNIINRDLPILIVEFEDHQLLKTGNSSKNLLDVLSDFGYYIFYLDYVYPSDHICVHKSKLEEFNRKFYDYIYEHTELNNVNKNIEIGINKKIKIPH